MKHKINPRIDCVFKSILGSEKNKLLLIDFLNSILQPGEPIEVVTILNPFNEKEFVSDKLTIVDIKAEDALKRQFQIEIQIASYTYLARRMAYTWSDIYAAQLHSGENYTELTPVISIWLLAKDLFKMSDTYHHHFQLYDRHQRCLLTEDCSIHVLELNKWQKPESLSYSDHWVYFFKEAHNWLTLPPDLDTPAMRQAMATLKVYSEKEIEYDRYRRRELYLHDQATLKKIQEMEKEQIEQEMEKVLQLSKVIKKENAKLGEEKDKLGREKDQLGKEKDQLGKEKDQLGRENAENKTEIERLRTLLERADIKV